KVFVQSREYLQQRRLNQLLKTALQQALSIKAELTIHNYIDYTLMLTSSRLRSLSQWQLYDPSLQAEGSAMHSGETPTITLESVGDLITQSEIDFRQLKINVLAVLEKHSQATIAEVLQY